MRKVLASAATLALVFASAEAHASYHLMKIVEVCAGTSTAPNAHYVMLQMYGGGQNFTQGHSITVFNAANAVEGTVNLTNVANGADNATILIGNGQVQAAFGVTPDFTTLPNLTAAGGKICFDGVDCFAWGTYPTLPASAASADSTGTPFAALGTQAAQRKIVGGTEATALDDMDDTGDSAADFQAGTPQPKANGITDGGSSGSSGSSGVGTTPTDGGGKLVDSGTSSGDNTGSSGGEGDGGCNVSPDAGAASAPLLALVVLGIVSRLRRRA